MFGTHFYNEGLRKLTIAFGQIFNNVIIQNTSSTGAITKRLRVPLAYAPKEKFLVRLEQQANLSQVLQDTPIGISDVLSLTLMFQYRQSLLHILRHNQDQLIVCFLIDQNVPHLFLQFLQYKHIFHR